MGVMWSRAPRTRVEIQRSYAKIPSLGVLQTRMGIVPYAWNEDSHLVQGGWETTMNISSEIFNFLKTEYAWTRFCQRLTEYFQTQGHNNEVFVHTLVTEREDDPGGEIVYWFHTLESANCKLFVQCTSDIHIGAAGPDGRHGPSELYSIIMTSTDEHRKRIPHADVQGIVQEFKRTLQEAEALWADSVRARNSAAALAATAKSHSALEIVALHHFGSGAKRANRDVVNPDITTMRGAARMYTDALRRHTMWGVPAPEPP